MRELKKSISVDFPPVRLYLDDVEQLFNILKKRAKSVNIETEKYELDDVAHLKEIKSDKIHKLTLSSSNPYISIDFESDSARVYISEDTTLNRGILSEIEDVIKRCRRRIAHIFHKSHPEFYLSAVAALSVLQVHEYMKGWLFGAFTALIITPIVLGIIFYCKIDFYQYSTIILSERHGQDTFFKRNRDGIVVGIIVAIITAVVTWLLVKLV